MKIISTICIALVVALLVPSLQAEETYPNFSRDYWQSAKKSAEGKKWRGVGLGVLGVASIAPSAILLYKATDNPQKFLAWGVVSSIATLGMTFHGFFSIRTGIKERKTAEGFIGQYDEDPNGVSVEAERESYLEEKKKSTAKIMIFGGALVVQSAALLANGIVLSIRKKNGRDLQDVKPWPSFLTGGLLFAGGTAIMVGKGLTYRSLKKLERSSPPSSATTALSFRPLIHYDPTSGETGIGLLGELLF